MQTDFTFPKGTESLTLPDGTIDDDIVFNNFVIYSQAISFVSAGGTGIGFEVVNPTSSNYHLFGTDTSDVVCKKIFMKMVVVSDSGSARVRVVNHQDWDRGGGRVSINSCPADAFVAELNMQNTIYRKSNSRLNAVCPPIIHAQLHDAAIGVQFATFMKGKSTNGTSSASMRDGLLDKVVKALGSLKQDGTPRFRLGVIAMGFTEGSVSVDHWVKKMTIRNRFNDARYIEQLAILELLRLYDMGYIHGDFSQTNMMFDPNYNYQGDPHQKGRVTLIDFGETFLHGKNPQQMTMEQKMNSMMDTAVVGLGGIVPREYRPVVNNPWKWLESFMILYTERMPEIEEMQDRVIDYETRVVEQLTATNTEIMSQIDAYNRDESNISDRRGMRGGGMLHGATVDVLSPVQTMMKSDMSVDFPKPLNTKLGTDLAAAGEKYLETMRRGERTILRVIDKVGATDGGRRGGGDVRQNRRNRRKTNRRRRTGRRRRKGTRRASTAKSRRRRSRALR